ncbi:MAG: OmpA family protein [Bacteroidales bacterium]|nr:OmpA family protein [Bacteroidales bacterium]
MRLFAAIVMVICLLAQPVFSQNPVSAGFNRVSVGLNAGVMTPFTDIKQKDYFPKFDEMSIGGGLNLEYHFTPVFGLRGQFLIGKLDGRDDSQNRRFETELWEANLSGIFSFSKLFSPRWSKNDRIDIYGLLGVGMVSYRSKVFLNEELERSYGYTNNGQDKDSRLNDLVVPVGLGVRFNLSQRVDLGIESTFRFTQTDKLDAVSRIFSKYDAYNYTSVGLIIKLGSHTRSMKWASPSVVMYPGDVNRMEFITERISEVDRRVEIIDQRLEETTYDREIADLRQQVQAIDQRQNELNNRMSTLADSRPAASVAESSVAALLSVYFRLNSSAIDNFNYERIASAARFLYANPEVGIELVGHTDITGPSAYNHELSERRAQSVYDVLVNDFNIDPARLSIFHRGPDDPLSQQNLSINRRVDFIIRSN